MHDESLIMRKEEYNKDGGRIFYVYSAPSKEKFYEEILNIAEKASKKLYSEVRDILLGK